VAITRGSQRDLQRASPLDGIANQIVNLRCRANFPISSTARSTARKADCPTPPRPRRGSTATCPPASIFRRTPTSRTAGCGPVRAHRSRPQCFTDSGPKREPRPHHQHPKPGAKNVAPLAVMNISQLADQVRDTPLREVLTHYGFDVKREGITLRAKTERHNIVVTEKPVVRQ
jgi:hypothetical protein